MGKARLAAELLKEKKYDWVVLHIKGTEDVYKRQMQYFHLKF